MPIINGTKSAAKDKLRPDPSFWRTIRRALEVSTVRVSELQQATDERSRSALCLQGSCGQKPPDLTLTIERSQTRNGAALRQLMVVG